MGWMSETTPFSLKPHLSVFDAVADHWGWGEQQFSKLAEQFQIHQTRFSSHSPRLEISPQPGPAIWLLTIKNTDFALKLEFLNRHKNQQITFVIIPDQLNSEQISQLINQAQIFSFITHKDELNEGLMQAKQDLLLKESYFQKLKQVKKQNRQLEILNQNLENLVHERTKKEFVASQETEVSLKDMQSILSFIKLISFAGSIEDLMNEVRGEYKKFHAIMPPVLLLTAGQSEIKFFYFQGKQFTQKIHFNSHQQKDLRTLNEIDLRSHLSNIFGRPFGAITIFDLEFQSRELKPTTAKMIFEHSLSSQNKNDFYDYSQERWPIINRAVENILLKESLQESAKQWSKTFNQIKDPILILNENYQMTLSNNELHRNKKSTCFQAFAHGTAPCLGCPIKKTFESGEPQFSDIHIEGRFYKVHSYPIRLADGGDVTHVINQYTDTTASVNLRSRVIQSEKMAAVGLLAGNIAHELNNPLTGIYSLSALLLEDLDKNSNTFKDLTEVKDAAARCQRIIKDLLDFSSVGADSKTKKIDINEMVSKTLPLLKMAMRNLNSELILSEQPLWVECNPQLLQQVIFNLVNNACQAMGEGGKLTVITSESGSSVQIIVRDTGSGIPDDIKSFIFDPFFTTKEEGKGTGLGLSMSKSVIERYNGRLILNEKYKEGTEFLINLPAVK